MANDHPEMTEALDRLASRLDSSDTVGRTVVDALDSIAEAIDRLAQAVESTVPADE